MPVRPKSIEKLSIAGAAGALEAVVEIPATPVEAVGVICHPHPAYGGTLENKVTHTLARSLLELGVVALRFNFRGAGGSDGEYAHGEGELEDAASAADWVQARWPNRELWLAGFSFGAMIALRLAARRTPAQLITVAPPVHRFDPSDIEQPECPWLVIQGEADELVDCERVVAWVNELEPGPELVVLPGVDHFFHGGLTQLRETLVTNLLRRTRSAR